MANLLGRFLRRDPEVTRFNLSQLFSQWAQQYGLATPLYPSAISYSRGKPSERIENSFTGYTYGGYKSNPVVFGCMTRRSSVFSEARFMWRHLEAGKPGDLFWGDGLKLLERPWPNGTTGELLTRMIQDVDLAGNCYLVNEGDRLRRLRPDWVNIVLSGNPLTDTDVDVLGYVYTPGSPDGGDGQAYMVDEICHWSPIPDPDGLYRGMSWLTPVVREIQGDEAATRHKLKFFEKGATLGPIVKVPQGVTSEQFGKFIDEFESRHAGVENAYATMYLGAGADVTLAAADFRQLDFAALSGKAETRICVAAGVPAVIAGVSEGLQGSSLNSGNYNSAKRSFVDGTLRTLWRSACAALSTIVEVPDDAELWFDESCIAYLRDDERDVAQLESTTMQTIMAGVNAGFEPDTVVLAAASKWKDILKHTGLTSVQLLPPGSPGEPSAQQVSGDDTSPSGDSGADVSPSGHGATPDSTDSGSPDPYAGYDSGDDVPYPLPDEEAQRSDLGDDDEVERADLGEIGRHYNPEQARVSKGHEGGGRFGSKLTALLEDYVKGGGKEAPDLSSVSRPTLRKYARDHGIATPRGMSDDVLHAAILDSALKGHPNKPSAPSAPSVPKPATVSPDHRQFQLTIGGKKVPAGVYTNNKGELSVYRETKTGNKSGAALVRVRSMSDLESWARDKGHDDLAQYAHEQQGGSPDAEKARDRQGRIDEAKSVSELLSQVHQDLDSYDGEVDWPSLQRRTDDAAKRLKTPDVDAKALSVAVSSHDEQKVRDTLDRIAADRGLDNVGGHAGEVVPFDRNEHQMVGGARQPRPGRYVRVARPGFSAPIEPAPHEDRTDGRTRLSKAQVEEATAEEIAAARPAKAAPEIKPSGDPHVDSVARQLADGQITAADAARLLTEHGKSGLPEVGEHETVHRPSAPPKPAKATPKPSKATLSDLRQAGSREEASALLLGLKRDDLRQVASELDLNPGGRATMATLRAAILDDLGHGATRPRVGSNIADIAEEVRRQPSEGAVIQLLAGDPALSAARLRKVADELGIEVPLNVKAKSALQLHIAERVSRDRGLGRVGSPPILPEVGHGESPNDDATPKLTDGQIRDRIQAAYDNLPKSVSGGGWVGLADLRDQLSDLPRADVDRALAQMNRQDNIRLSPVANRRTLTQRDRDAALIFPGEDEGRHMIAIDAPTVQDQGAGNPDGLDELARDNEPSLRDLATEYEIPNARTRPVAELVSELRAQGARSPYAARVEEPAVPAVHAPSVPTGAKTDQQVEDDIRQAYASLVREPGGWVTLTDLRQRLGDQDRAQVDRVLARMHRSPNARLHTENNQKAMTGADREAGVLIGNQRRDNLALAPVDRFTDEQLRQELADRGGKSLSGAQYEAHHDRILRTLTNEQIRHELDRRQSLARPVLQAAEPARPVTSPDSQQRQAEVEQAVRDAYQRASTRGGSDLVNLADVRREVGGDYSRPEVDAALGRLFRQPGVSITPESNQKLLTDEERNAALTIGNQPRHVLRIRSEAQPDSPTTHTASTGMVSSFEPSPEVSRIAQQAAAAKTRDEADSLLADLSRDELGQVAKERGIAIPSGLSRDQTRRHILNKLDDERESTAGSKSQEGVDSSPDAIAHRAGVASETVDRAREIMRQPSPVPFKPIVTPQDQYLAPWLVAPQNADYAELRRLYESNPALYNSLARERQIDQAWEADLKRRYPGKTLAEAHEAATEALRQAVKDAPVVVRRNRESTLRDILTSGRMKTQFETGSSGGLLDTQARTTLEDFTFGLPSDLPVAERPVYGVVSTGGIRPASEKQAVNAYGDIQIVLKPQVRDRTTVTVGDSLAPEGNATRPAPIDNPDWRAAGPTGLKNLGDPRFQARDYIEAQVQGGVNVGDIQEVVFARQPEPETVTALEAAGVPWRVLTK